MIDAHTLKSLIEAEIPDAQVRAQDYSGSGDKFQVEVISPSFAGKPRVRQHQMVYAALQEHLDSGALHAVALQTKAE